jgi:hypothetical protein
MTVDTTPCPPATTARNTAARPAGHELPDIALLEGWQALAVASLGRLLTGPELAAVEHLPVEISLDLLFAELDDAARHEALSTLDDR